MRRVNGKYNMTRNRELAKPVDVNLQRIRMIQCTNEEQQFERDMDGREWVPQIPPGPPSVL
ncbi:MAG: hypothetical protein QNI99_13380 [Woeseiaceae bacterium]|nr:hypothetical protein [Woeseiaceae bacterium]